MQLFSSRTLFDEYSSGVASPWVSHEQPKNEDEEGTTTVHPIPTQLQHSRGVKGGLDLISTHSSSVACGIPLCCAGIPAPHTRHPPSPPLQSSVILHFFEVKIIILFEIFISAYVPTEGKCTLKTKNKKHETDLNCQPVNPLSCNIVISPSTYYTL